MKKYNVAIYLRLSSSDGDSIESQSIDNQRLVIKNYINSHLNEFNLIKEYIDDGYSGSNFDRPSWNQLINDIKLHSIDTIITKDLSRMGRDYITMGSYIERIFPQNKIRYIAITDDIDTLYETPGLEYLQFKLIFNDLYLKDISKKIRKVLIEKKKEGKYLSWKAPYGYKKRNKYELIIDKNSSRVVKYIFELAKEYNVRTIANILNEEGIKTPSQYANLSKQSSYWSPKTIKDILTNEIYLGKLIQGKRKKINYKTKKEEKVDKDKWIIVKQPHLKIIDENIFKSVNNTRKQKFKIRKSNKTLLFSGLLRCKECKHALTINTNKKNNRSYTVCSYYLKNTKNKLCTAHSNNYEKLEECVLLHIKQLIKDNIDTSKLIDILKKQLNKTDLQNNKNKLLREKSMLVNNIEKIYEDKINDKLSMIDYDKLIKKYELKIKNIDNLLSNIKDEISSKNNINEVVTNYLNLNNINRQFMSKLIDYIEIDQSKNITIYFNFIT